MKEYTPNPTSYLEIVQRDKIHDLESENSRLRIAVDVLRLELNEEKAKNGSS